MIVVVSCCCLVLLVGVDFNVDGGAVDCCYCWC